MTSLTFVLVFASDMRNRNRYPLPTPNLQKTENEWVDKACTTDRVTPNVIPKLTAVTMLFT